MGLQKEKKIKDKTIAVKTLKYKVSLEQYSTRYRLKGRMIL